MLKHIFSVVVFVISVVSTAQNFSSLWEGHFAYYDIKDVAQGNDKVFAASENAIYTYDLDTNEIEKITTVEGLSGETISTIKYSEAFQLLLVGYENGLIEIVFDTDEEILSVVDILDKETISPAIKRINHFNEFEGLIYIFYRLWCVSL